MILKIFFLVLLFNNSYSQDSLHISIIEKEKLMNRVISAIDSNKSFMINDIKGSDSLRGEYSGEVAMDNDKKIQKITCLFSKLNSDIIFYYSKDQLICISEGFKKIYFISNNLYDSDGISIDKYKQNELTNLNNSLRSMIKLLFRDE